MSAPRAARPDLAELAADWCECYADGSAVVSVYLDPRRRADLAALLRLACPDPDSVADFLGDVLAVGIAERLARFEMPVATPAVAAPPAGRASWPFPFPRSES